MEASEGPSDRSNDRISEVFCPHWALHWGFERLLQEEYMARGAGRNIFLSAPNLNGTPHPPPRWLQSEFDIWHKGRHARDGGAAVARKALYRLQFPVYHLCHNTPSILHASQINLATMRGESPNSTCGNWGQGRATSHIRFITEFLTRGQEYGREILKDFSRVSGHGRHLRSIYVHNVRKLTLALILVEIVSVPTHWSVWLCHRWKGGHAHARHVFFLLLSLPFTCFTSWNCQIQWWATPLQHHAMRDSIRICTAAAPWNFCHCMLLRHGTFILPTAHKKAIAIVLYLGKSVFILEEKYVWNLTMVHPY